MPFVQNYTSENAPAFSSNVYAIFQDNKGLIYVSDKNNLYTYNGTSWETTPSVTDHVRALAQDASGKVWVGTVAGFGYLEEDASGKKRYISLFEQLMQEEKNLPTVWQIYPTDYGIYVCTQKFIFLFKKQENGAYKKMMSFSAQGNYILFFKIGNNLYLTESNKAETEISLCLIKNDKKETLYKEGNTTLGNTYGINKIYGINKVTENELFIIIQAKGIYTFDLGKKALKKFPTPTNEILEKAFAYCTITLKNGNIAIGTHYNGIFVIDKQGEIIAHINESNGLISNHIHDLIEDKQGSLWVGSGQSVAKIILSLPFKTFNKYHQVKGRVHSLLKDKNEFYMGNDLGVFYLENEKFQIIEGTQSQHWQLIPYQQGMLSAGGNAGVFYFENKRVISKLEAENSVMQIAVSKQDSRIIYVATYGGLRVFSFENKHFKDLGLLKDTQADCRSLYELPDGRLWVGTSSNGFHLITFPQGKKTPELVQKAQVKHYTKGLNETKHNKVFFVNHQLLFTSQTGLYTFNESKETFEKTNLLEADFSLPHYQNPILKEDKHGNIWLLNALTIAQKHTDGHFVLDSLSLLPIEKAANTLFEDDNEIYWVGNTEAIYRFDKKITTQQTDFRTHIHQVAISGTDSLLALNSKENLLLDYQYNSLIFSFSTDNFLNERGNQYQYFLENYDKKWSDWTSFHQKEYTNLKEGTYTFRVKSKNLYGYQGKEATYTLTIRPPWYRSWWAYLAYFFSFIAFIYLIIKLYTRSLKMEKEKLEQTVRERTKEISIQNEVLHKQKEEILLQQAELINQREEILVQAEELVKMNATKDKLFSIISHDLKSPFNRLRGILRLLDMEGLTQEEFLDYSKKLRKNADNLYDTLDNLLRWSMLQMQKGMVTTVESVAIYPVVEEIRKLYEESIEEKEIEVLNQIHEGTQAHADPNQVKLILRNLIANAIKFTHTKGKICIISNIEENKLKISVIDEGVGMSEEQVGKLFDIRANNPQKGTSGEKGTGIGLLLVKEFVESNQGNITVQSKEGEGSTFTVSLHLPW